MDHLLEGLNAQQTEAVCLPAEHALIIAGAGSGKTRVLTTRVAWLLANGHAKPRQILAVTFTNKAAKEMLTRIQKLLPLRLNELWVGTFHGLCHRMLRAHAAAANLPAGFQIIDTADQLAAVKRIAKAMNISEQIFPAKSLLYFINQQKEAGRRHNMLSDDDGAPTQLEVYLQYEQQCQAEGNVDFAELLLRCYELLLHNEPLRHHYQARFRHILVDEVQDTNQLQYQWLQLLAGVEGGNPQSTPAAIFAVGDDDQSIYGFRGADISNMRHFEQQLAKSVIRLEQNYRSQKLILDAANAVIAHNQLRLGKNLWTLATHGEALRYYAADTDVEEAEFVVDEIRALIDDGVPLQQIAILYRSNAQSRYFEHTLFSRRIAYRIYGGLRFFERQEIKHAMAYCRLLLNAGDDTAFLRVVNVPLRGIGAKTIAQLQTIATREKCSLMRALPLLEGKAAALMQRFALIIHQLQAMLDKGAETGADFSIAELMDAVLNHSGLIEYYESDPEKEQRLENLSELVNAAKLFAYERQDISGSLAEQLTEFLSFTALEADSHQQLQPPQQAVQLMTIHAAKGLEFDVVFVCGLEQGIFPHSRSMSEGDLEEERRLMYVALTRARQTLYLTWAEQRLIYGQYVANVASLFIKEIPRRLLRIMSENNYSSFKNKDSDFDEIDPNDESEFDTNNNAVASNQSASAHSSAEKGIGIGTGGTGIGSGLGSGIGTGIGTGIGIGQRVRHAKFGCGVVIQVEGGRRDCRLLINFETAGQKWLMQEQAKLQIEPN